MNLVVSIPDQLATRLSQNGSDLERQALEALVLESYRAGHMSTDDVCEALGFGSLNEVDGFLKARGLYEEYTVEEINRQVATLAEIGF